MTVREIADGPLRFLSSVAGYYDSFTCMGITSSDIATLSSELVDQLVAWGDAGAIKARISGHPQAERTR